MTDPQKYADARLHDDYVAALATHDAVTIVVLNQVDRLTDAEVEECVADLTRLMARDGMPRRRSSRRRRAPAVASTSGQRLSNAVSARTPPGPVWLRTCGWPPTRSRGRRLRAGRQGRGRDELVDALARAAGVPTVVGPSSATT